MFSYRPVAPASCVKKVMERMVLATLKWLLKHYNLYPFIMSSFRRGRNSVDSVIAFTMSGEHQKAQCQITVAVFLDVKGAFNNVAHDNIIKSLEELGIGGRLYTCVLSCLTGRSIFISPQDGDTRRCLV